MSNHMETLFYTIKLIDEASGGTAAVIRQIDKVQQHYQEGMQSIATGAAGVFGAGYSLKRLMEPAIEMDRAMGGLKSLLGDDVGDALKHLEKTALVTSIKYGMNAADIVNSSYDIQSAIAGLHGKELAEFTRASAILAKGTKADAATITDYMGTMYGIFKNSADAMGKGDWVKMLTGQTATAVQMFKTNGSKMAAGFAGLGAEATSFGVAMNEQMAILGTLQATMGGGESATKYRAFLAGVGKAQDALGLKLTDSQGRLLPMVDILEKLRGKFGDTFDVAESDALSKAFGSKEATGLIKLLMADTKGLASSIDKLGRVTGMKTAEKMARDLSDMWEQGGASVSAVATVFGRVLQPALVPVFQAVQDGAAQLLRWMELAPNLTRIVGGLTLGVLALVAGFSVLAVVGGMCKMVMAGWAAATAMAVVIGKSFIVFTKAAQATWFLFQMALWGGSVAITALKAGLVTMLPAVWGFTAALLANPITWIVAGIVAFVAVVALAIKHWDTIKKTLMDITPFKVLQTMIKGAIALLNMIPGVNIGINASAEKASMNKAAGMNASGDLSVNGGGLMTQISNATNNSGTTVEKIEVNTTGGVNGYQLADELTLAAG